MRGVSILAGLLCAATVSGQATRPGRIAVAEEGRVLVTDYGAQGDGVKDDTGAFQRAVDSLKFGGIVIVPASAAYYKIGTITLKAGVQVSAVAAIMRPSSDVDLIRMAPGSSWIGGRFDCSASGYTSSVFVFDGTDRYNTSTQRTILRDVQFLGGLGVGKGTAIDMRSLTPGNVWGVYISNLYIRGFEYGLRQRIGGAIHTSWMNGNTFEHLWFDTTVKMVTQEFPSADYYDINTNSFLDLYLQFGNGYTTKGISIAGGNNIIDASFFDWLPGSTPIEFLPTSRENYGNFRGLTLRVSDAGVYNSWVNPYQNAWKPIAVPFDLLDDPPNGIPYVDGLVIHCPDCAPNTNPCTGSGTGAIAKRLNAAWDCR